LIASKLLRIGAKTVSKNKFIMGIGTG